MRSAAPVALAALTALTVACAPSDEPADPTTTTVAPPRAAATTTAATAAPTGTAGATGTSAPNEVISVMVAEGRVTPPPGPVQVKLGSTIVIEVTSDVADQVHVHGYDQLADLRPRVPARLEVVADRPGEFEVELESAHLLLFTLTVA